MLGIHDLPGGFGPYVLAPVDALVEVPEEIDLDTAALMEPLAAAVTVDSLTAVDHALRPSPDSERGLVRPLGTIYLRNTNEDAAIARLLNRGVALTTSRCGDFRSTLARLTRDAGLRRVGATMITHRFDQKQLVAAFQKARERDCLKAIVLPVQNGESLN